MEYVLRGVRILLTLGILEHSPLLFKLIGDDWVSEFKCFAWRKIVQPDLTGNLHIIIISAFLYINYISCSAK